MLIGNAVTTRTENIPADSRQDETFRQGHK
jgi:hypothetical protein